MTLVELFSKPGAWCQGPIAKADDGSIVDYHDPKAVSWCLFGGYMKVYANSVEGGSAYERLTLILNSRGYTEGLMDYSESAGRTQEEILSLCQEAGV